jgi:hypothetical protein
VAAASLIGCIVNPAAWGAQLMLPFTLACTVGCSAVQGCAGAAEAALPVLASCWPRSPRCSAPAGQPASRPASQPASQAAGQT